MFTQKGPVPAWRMVYELVRAKTYGERVTEAEIRNLLTGYSCWRSPVYKANKVLEEQDKKTLVSVRGDGYIIAQPNGHEPIAQKRIVRSRRQLRKGRHTVENVNFAFLTPEEKVEALECAQRIAWILKASNKRTFPVEEPKKDDEVRAHIEAADANLRWLRKKLKVDG